MAIPQRNPDPQEDPEMRRANAPSRFLRDRPALKLIEHDPWAEEERWRDRALDLGVPIMGGLGALLLLTGIAKLF